MALSINGDFGLKKFRANEKTPLLQSYKSSISPKDNISTMIKEYFNQTRENKKKDFQDLNWDVADESEKLTDEDKTALFNYLKTEKTDKDGDCLINSLKKLDRNEFPGVKHKIDKIERLKITIYRPESAYNIF